MPDTLTSTRTLPFLKKPGKLSPGREAAAPSPMPNEPLRADGHPLRRGCVSAESCRLQGLWQRMAVLPSPNATRPSNHSLWLGCVPGAHVAIAFRRVPLNDIERMKERDEKQCLFDLLKERKRMRESMPSCLLDRLQADVAMAPQAGWAAGRPVPGGSTCVRISQPAASVSSSNLACLLTGSSSKTLCRS